MFLSVTSQIQTSILFKDWEMETLTFSLKSQEGGVGQEIIAKTVTVCLFGF